MYDTVSKRRGDRCQTVNRERSERFRRARRAQTLRFFSGEVEHRYDAQVGLSGRRLAQFENRGFGVFEKPLHQVAPEPQEVRDGACRAVSQTNPDHLRWSPAQQRKSMEVFVLAHKQAAMAAGALPYEFIRGATESDR
jgi:hypothetical protein